MAIRKKRDEVCPKCAEDSLNYYGLGTEKLEETINSMYPGIRVVRMDQDTTRNKGTHEKIKNIFENLLDKTEGKLVNKVHKSLEELLKYKYKDFIDILKNE